MASDDDNRLIIKRTFEDTLGSQENLRGLLEQLIQGNRCLTDAEQSMYHRLLARSTLGLGRDVPYRITISPLYGKETLGSVERVARSLSRATGDHLSFEREMTPGSRELSTVDVPLSRFWETLLTSLYDIFADALEKSASMSKEVEPNVTGSGYRFNPED